MKPTEPLIGNWTYRSWLNDPAPVDVEPPAKMCERLTSLLFAELVAKEMKAQGLEYAHQYTQPIMGHYQHPLLNKETGVYSYDQLVVLRTNRIPAVLLEAGSIINRDEELKMISPERQDIIAGGVTAAVKEFCDSRWAILGPL